MTSDPTIFHLTFLVSRQLRGVRPASSDDAVFRSRVEEILDAKIHEEGAVVSARQRAEIVGRVIALAAQRPIADHSSSASFHVHTSRLHLRPSRTRRRLFASVLTCALFILLWSFLLRRRRASRLEASPPA